MRYPRADGRGEHAYGHDADQGGQVDEAQSVFGQAGRIPAVGDEAESAGKGDGCLLYTSHDHAAWREAPLKVR